MMRNMNQTSLGFDALHKKTHKEIFLQEMELVVPWAQLEALIAPPARGARQYAQASCPNGALFRTSRRIRQSGRCRSIKAAKRSV